MEPSFLILILCPGCNFRRTFHLWLAEYIGQQWSDDEQDKAYWQECEEPCAPVRATIPDLADNSRANGFGAAPVKKIELDTHVVANATQFK